VVAALGPAARERSPMSVMRRIADQSQTSGDFREVPNADAVTFGHKIPNDRLDFARP
jgi:hypothetical protein